MLDTAQLMIVHDQIFRVASNPNRALPDQTQLASLSPTKIAALPCAIQEEFQSIAANNLEQDSRSEHRARIAKLTFPTVEPWY